MQHVNFDVQVSDLRIHIWVWILYRIYMLSGFSDVPCVKERVAVCGSDREREKAHICISLFLSGCVGMSWPPL